MYCPTCQYHWSEVQDTGYLPPSWTASQQTPWKQQTRSSRSPRTRGPSQGRARQQWDWNSEQWPEVPRPLVVAPPKGKGKGKEPVWQPPALPASTSGTLSPDTMAPTGAASQQLKELLGALKKDQEKLSPEVLSMIQQAQVQDSRNTTRQLHVAVSQLGQSRKILQDLEKAKISLYQSWATFLADSVERWTSYTEDFKTKDVELHRQIEEAKKAVHKSKENFVATQKASGASSVEAQVISDEEDLTLAPEGVSSNLDNMMTHLQEMKRNIDETIIQQTKRQRIQPETTEEPAVPKKQDLHEGGR